MEGLWDSWEHDAFTHDVENGVYFDAAKLHVLDHQGAHFAVKGPLNIARPPQGRPVIVQAGASEAGRQIAAETAELVFTYQTDLISARLFHAEMQSRARRHTHAAPQDHPAVFVVLGDSWRRHRKSGPPGSAGRCAQQPGDPVDALGHDISATIRRPVTAYSRQQCQQERTRQSGATGRREH